MNTEDRLITARNILRAAHPEAWEQLEALEESLPVGEALRELRKRLDMALYGIMGERRQGTPRAEQLRLAGDTLDRFTDQVRAAFGGCPVPHKPDQIPCFSCCWRHDCSRDEAAGQLDDVGLDSPAGASGEKLEREIERTIQAWADRQEAPEDIAGWHPITTRVTEAWPSGKGHATERTGRYKPGSTLGDVLDNLAKISMDSHLEPGDVVRITLHHAGAEDQGDAEEIAEESDPTPGEHLAEVALRHIHEVGPKEPECTVPLAWISELQEAAIAFREAQSKLATSREARGIGPNDILPPGFKAPRAAGEALKPDGVVAIVILPRPPAGEG